MPKMLQIKFLHWTSLKQTTWCEQPWPEEDVLMLFPQILSSSMVMEKAVEMGVVYEEVVVAVVGAMVLSGRSLN